jgi:hypothetical protein
MRAIVEGKAKLSALSPNYEAAKRQQQSSAGIVMLSVECWPASWTIVGSGMGDLTDF